MSYGEAYKLTEGNISITLYGPVSHERDLAERKIARHRDEQLNYVRPRPVERRSVPAIDRD